MATTSPDNLRTPNPGDPYNLVADLATLANDTQVALNKKVSNLLKGTTAERTAATGIATVGMLWQDTDGIKMIWRKDGAAWVPAVWRWSGTSSQRTGFTQAPDGFEWFDTSDNSEYIRRSGAWYKAFITASATYSGPNVTGPSMFLTTGISGARPGATAFISWAPFGVFNASIPAIITSSVHITTNGTTPTAASTQVAANRAYVPSAGSVVSTFGGTVTTVIAASGQLNAGLYLPARLIYGSDGGMLSILVNN